LLAQGYLGHLYAISVLTVLQGLMNGIVGIDRISDSTLEQFLPRNPCINLFLLYMCQIH
jgi:hypothetical protein